MVQIHRVYCLLVSLAILPVSKVSLAATLFAPVGGAPIAVPDGQVLCGDPGGGWQADAGGTSLRAPTDGAHVGKTMQVRIAPAIASCATSKDSIIVGVSGPIPVVDRHSVDLWVDEGRVELRGSNLDGTRLEWETKGEHGSDVCIAPTTTNGVQLCSYSVSKKFPADAAASSIRLLPAGAVPHAEIYDAMGHRIAEDALALTPARMIVSNSLASESHIDLSTGEGRLSLNHPEAVASADCDTGRCELVDEGIRVRGVTSSARTVTLGMRLGPRIFARKGDTFTQSVSIPLDITYCPLSVVSPPPLRDTDDVRVVVRADARCGANTESIRWTSNGNPITVLDTESRDSFVYMLLGIGRINTERVTLAAMRGASDSSVIGQTSIATVAPPQLRIQLHLSGFGEIDFVPTNRDATLSATAPNLRGRIVTLPVAGVYTVKEQDGRTSVRGDTGGGYVVLRFALRDDSLPGHLAQADLAHFSGSVQRAVKEVNVAAPIGLTNSKAPIAEVLCTDPSGHAVGVIPGVPLHVPFAQRDGCRLIIHRERIPIEDGEQRLNVDIDVTSVAGLARSGGHFSQRLLLRHGTEPRVIWIHGVTSQFDRITVQLTHITDESQYIRGGGERLEVPAGQWTIVAENTRWRLYATAAIPVQLFRFSNDRSGAGTGPLSLNLGVLSRFTWVTRDGTEGILGLEGGVMGMGLAADNTRQLNIVGGLGLGVPLGNAGQPSQASINIHAWVAYRLGNELAPELDATGNAIPGSSINLNHWSFIFGPSVSFGNLGFDL